MNTNVSILLINTGLVFIGFFIFVFFISEAYEHRILNKSIFGMSIMTIGVINTIYLSGGNI